MYVGPPFLWVQYSTHNEGAPFEKPRPSITDNGVIMLVPPAMRGRSGSPQATLT